MFVCKTDKILVHTAIKYVQILGVGSWYSTIESECSNVNLVDILRVELPGFLFGSQFFKLRGIG
jgi:hypothetical protein